MSQTVSITCHLPGDAGPVCAGTSRWGDPLPGPVAGLIPENPDRVTIKEYFSAATAVLVQDNYALLRAAGEPDIQKIREVALCLEKHGACYHPLRLTIRTVSGQDRVRVLNGAVADPGLTVIETEYRLMADLVHQVTPSFIPRVYGFGRSEIPGKGPAAFFLGEWFQGYCEFHARQQGADQVLDIWQDDGSIRVMPLDRAASAYARIAYILTAYHDIFSGREIGPWHLAAGDFVLSAREGAPDVKLIAVRGYRSLADGGESDAPGVRMLSSLLFFYLNLTLRIRLDRSRGTGPILLLPEWILSGVHQGFFEALRHKADGTLKLRGEPVSGDLPDAFAGFLAGFSPEQMTAILERLVDAWHPEAPEREVVTPSLSVQGAYLHRLSKKT